MAQKKAVVLATCRPRAFKEWFDQWSKHFRDHDVTVYVMHDTFSGNDSKNLRESINHDERVTVLNHNTVITDMKNNSFIIPTGSGSCKSYAVYRAWKEGADRVFCLDDDCYPSPDNDGGISWIDDHILNLGKRVNNTVYRTASNFRPRGVPYLAKVPVRLSHGLWLNVPDVDAMTQINEEIGDVQYPDQEIPRGCLFPFSGMNWGCCRDIAPLMYFGLHGDAHPFDRYDDIWCGFIVKKILDHLGFAVWSGEPTIEHIRMSDPFINLEKESRGYQANMRIYKYMMDIDVSGNNPVDCLRDVGMSIIELGKMVKAKNEAEGKYWKSYGTALNIWTDLFRLNENGGNENEKV